MCGVTTSSCGERGHGGILEGDGAVDKASFNEARWSEADSRESV